MEQRVKNIYDLLKKYYGYDSFRKNQEDIINHILSGRDAAAIMPTGAGKSICYQIPALAMDGITLVISPLISLMQDQVRALISNGVRAAYLNSSLSPGQMELAIRNAAAGVYKIIYVAPERLEAPSFMRFACQADISLIAVDEAHCVSQWGQDFRPSYLRIADFIGRLPNRPPVAALTATATERVKKDILEKLGLRNPFTVTASFDRPNLYFGIHTPIDNIQFISDYIARRPDDSGIIYCSTRKETEKVVQELRANGFSALPYHAGMSDSDRKYAQEEFTYDRTKIIVATNAFGMGIDKPNVRFVIHNNMPSCIEDYYQQAGRAGRDGDPADCILLYSGRDVRLQSYMIHQVPENDSMTAEQRREFIEAEEEKLKLMTFYATSKSVCLRKRLLQYFGEYTKSQCSNCSVCNEDIQERSVGFAEGGSMIIDEALLARLRAKTRLISMQQSVPIYSVAGDAMLRELAVKKPRELDGLRKISGFGEEKIRRFGKIFVDVINQYEEEADF